MYFDKYKWQITEGRVSFIIQIKLKLCRLQYRTFFFCVFFFFSICFPFTFNFKSQASHCREIHGDKPREAGKNKQQKFKDIKKVSLFSKGYVPCIFNKTMLDKRLTKLQMISRGLSLIDQKLIRISIFFFFFFSRYARKK